MDTSAEISAMRPTRFLSEPGDSYYGTPKEFWDFRTPPSDDPPKVIAHRFLKANADRRACPQP